MILPFIGGVIVGFGGTIMAIIGFFSQASPKSGSGLAIPLLVVAGIIGLAIYEVKVVGMKRFLTPFRAGLIVGVCLLALLAGLCVSAMSHADFR
jgi:hypothetical protein